MFIVFRPAIQESIDALFQDVLNQVVCTFLSSPVFSRIRLGAIPQKLGVHTKSFLSRALEPLHRDGKLKEDEVHRLKNLAYTFYAGKSPHVF